MSPWDLLNHSHLQTLEKNRLVLTRYTLLTEKQRIVPTDPQPATANQQETPTVDATHRATRFTFDSFGI
ncbi:MAG: hypothetical protein CMJ81_21560 [Planctomycetaceae bacterium]|nr:hypothetical protein [Planctomycetaceae bacterium]